MVFSDPPIVEKINEINAFISHSTLQEIQGAFVTIIDVIFGLSENRDGWDLFRLMDTTDSYLFEYVRKFLSPVGHLLDTITNRLSTEVGTCKYEFPISLLSTYNALILPNPNVSLVSTVSLNAFEYYIFAFLSYPLHPKRAKRLILSEFEHSVYTAVFTDYLAFYFYIDSTSLNLLDSRLQLIKAVPQTAVFQRNYFIEHSNAHNIPDFVDLQHHLPDQNFLWQTESFLQAIFEFLLSWRSSDLCSKPSNNAGGVTELPFSQGIPILPQSHAELSFKPTSCHLYLVRCFLKYFYYTAFHHTPSISFQTPYKQLLYSRVTSYHRFLCSALCLPPSNPSGLATHHNLMSQLKQLLIFCFRHWSLDLSFEVVLETWLTSIQPWRYAQTPQPYGSCSPPLFRPTESATNTVQPIPNDTCPYSWVSFATQQYSLYVVPLLLFLQRAIRMDLRVYRNAHMLYRVAKVFSQPGLKIMLHNAEAAVLQQAIGTTQSPLGDQTDVSSDLEQTGIWGAEFADALNQLLTVISGTLSEVHAKISKAVDTNTDRGMWNRFTDFLTELFLEDENAERVNLRKCEQYLNDTVSLLQNFFAIDQQSSNDPIPKSPVVGRLQWDDTAESPLLPVPKARVDSEVQTPQRRVQFALASPTMHLENTFDSHFREHSSEERAVTRPVSRNRPDTMVTEYGQQMLTPLGRFQILMGQRRPDVKYSGDREFLPAYTYEIPALVELFRSLSAFINVQMRSRFISWCSSPTLSGWIARHLLLPAGSRESTSPMGHGRFGSGNPVQLDEPRISLRWLASYAVLGRIAVLYLLAFVICGIRSPLVFSVYLLLTYATFLFLRLAYLFVRERVQLRKHI
ncbi:hypothetical protein PHET_03739 [Paragonimus heterotremus]|uniref:Sphingomyelin phosphodiesterase 4 n=1 Tax=Paragonimus heterotremus TaxID=100268 RepID=A0A8J4WIU3_9TREM|nr:hypothetical protein PHET_03739 [Paragonimus heterotremus]